ncbi:PhnA domain-containing protein [Flavobacterium capsici]|uniref:PhnA domain-containing protein n=1 Tax=Flavobacterium capsici TaxID=3075618 RepID=A0AA96EZF3_9FLAO|nr:MULTISPECIES: PhnA domain-containing protein [unclassified Flavobacterium]WNM19588.1 PhnA domain-containing protein [Flavobacterium sp. PMR2A8]WNM20977.1 PhnA domain-containing protein [Flavobacterium sp. PMTSA4]
MSIVTEKRLKDRSGSVCEISGSNENLVVYLVEPKTEDIPENCVLISKNLKDQIENPETMNPNDWRGLSDSMWNENLPVQIVSWRMLARMKNHDLLDMMYLDDDALEWAKATGEADDDEGKIIHKDSNGNILNDGDSVVLIKDLDVKGANFTAKRGAAVHNIKLVWDNAEQIEGRVENQHIVILTQYVKKTK